MTGDGCICHCEERSEEAISKPQLFTEVSIEFPVLRTQLAAQAVLPAGVPSARSVLLKAEASFSTPKGICRLNHFRVSCATRFSTDERAKIRERTLENVGGNGILSARDHQFLSEITRIFGKYIL
jgi:hypothetical protein